MSARRGFLQLPLSRDSYVYPERNRGELPRLPLARSEAHLDTSLFVWKAFEPLEGSRPHGCLSSGRADLGTQITREKRKSHESLRSRDV